MNSVITQLSQNTKYDFTGFSLLFEHILLNFKSYTEYVYMIIRRTKSVR